LDKLWSFIYTTRRNPCRNLNRCYLVEGDTKTILTALGIPVTPAQTASAVAEIPSPEIEPGAAALIRAELFTRLGYSSWALRQLRGVRSKGGKRDQMVVHAFSPRSAMVNEIRARAAADMLRLDDAERALRRCRSASAGDDERLLEIALELAELAAFRVVTHRPLTRVGDGLPSARVYSIKLTKALTRAVAILKRTEGSAATRSQYNWARRRLVALDLVRRYWDKSVKDLPRLLDSVSLPQDSSIADPFLIGMLYLIYWRSTGPLWSEPVWEAESEESLKIARLYELVTKHDAIRDMFPESIYGPAAANTPHTPLWRTLTWTPIIKRDESLAYSHEVFVQTDNHLWAIALGLITWDEELRRGEVGWSSSTAMEIFLCLQKAGAVGPSMLFGLHFLDALEDRWPSPHRDRVASAFAAYQRDAGPTIAKFLEFDPDSVRCLRRLLSEQEYEHVAEQFVEIMRERGASTS
jgi:hypothetical protein